VAGNTLGDLSSMRAAQSMLLAASAAAIDCGLVLRLRLQFQQPGEGASGLANRGACCLELGNSFEVVVRFRVRPVRVRQIASLELMPEVTALERPR
jgi:hypothetical protein